MNNAVETLKAAKAVIATPEAWIKRDFARKERENSDGSLYGNDAEATCFCGLGAIQKVTNVGDKMWENPLYMKARDYLTTAIAGYEYGDFPRFNDAPTTTHEMVLDAFDRAIALAEAGGTA